MLLKEERQAGKEKEHYWAKQGGGESWAREGAELLVVVIIIINYFGLPFETGLTFLS